MAKLWRPDRAIRNFLVLHSLQYRTNRVGGVDIYFKHAPPQRMRNTILCVFGSNTTHEKVLKFITTSLEHRNGQQAQT